MAFSRRASREMLLLLGLCLLMVGALALWLRKHSATQTAANYTVSPWHLGGTSYTEARAAISPDGAYVAGICPAATPTASGAPASGASPNGARTYELVIWRASDGQEVSRAPVDAESQGLVQWSSSGQLVATVGRFAQVFNATANTPSTAPISRLLNGPAGSTDLDVSRTWLDLDSDLKLQEITDGQVQAFRVSTGAAIPLNWRWRANASATSMTWTMAIAPAAPGGPVRAAIVQVEAPPPTPTPTATVTPRGTPTPNPEQSAFLQKKSRLEDELSDIISRIQDEHTSADEAARLETRTNEINKELRAGNALLLPPARATHSTTTTTLAPTYVRMSLVNLQTGATLWQHRLRAGFFSSGMTPFWSPDGKTLVLTGTPRKVVRSTAIPSEDSGVEFFDGATGKHLASSALDDDPGWTHPGDVSWLPGPVLMVKDHRGTRALLAHTFNPRTGQTLHRWAIPDTGNTDEILAPDALGTRWLVASGEKGWRVLTQGQLSEAPAPPKS